VHELGRDLPAAVAAEASGRRDEALARHHRRDLHERALGKPDDRWVPVIARL